MSYWVRLLALVLLFGSSAEAAHSLRQQGPIEIEVAVEQTPPYYLNGRIEAQLTLRIDGHVYGEVELLQPNIDGAVVLYNVTEPFDKEFERQVAKPRQVLRKKLVLYPRQAGQFTLPPLRINSVYYGNDSKEYHQAQLQSAPLTLTIERPPGVDQQQSPLVATEVQLGASIEPEQSQFQIGDAVSLSYSIYATNTAAMLLPRFAFPEIEGTSRYLKPEQVDNHHNYRGQPVAVRTEKAVYIFQQPGQFVLPAQHVQWWNSDSGQLQHAQLPERQWQVMGPPPPLWSWQRAGLLLPLAAILALLWQLWRQRHKVVRLWQRLRRSEQKQLLRQLWQQHHQQQWPALWQTLTQLHPKPQLQQHPQGQQLLELAFGKQAAAPLTKTQLQQLLHWLKQSQFAEKSTRQAKKATAVNPLWLNR